MFYRYRRLRFPDAWSYPGALLNAIITAIIDEVAFRGAVLGMLLLTGLEPTAANAIQAILYALTTRLGAPGRNRWMLVMAILVGLAGGWVTAVTRDRAASSAMPRRVFAAFRRRAMLASPCRARRGRGHRGEARDRRGCG